MVEKRRWGKSYQTKINGKRRSRGRRLPVQIFEKVFPKSSGLKKMKRKKEGCCSSSLQRLEKIEIRANLWLTRREGEKDKFALKWVRWRSGPLEGFLIVGSWQAKRQKWSARRDLSNEPKITAIGIFWKNTQFFLNCKLPSARVKRTRNQAKLRRHYSNTIRNSLTIKPT